MKITSTILTLDTFSELIPNFIKKIYMQKNKSWYLIFLICTFLLACTGKKNEFKDKGSLPKVVIKDEFLVKQLHLASDQLDSAIIEDLFSPPVASRVYLYPYLATYYCVTEEDSKFDLNLELENRNKILTDEEVSKVIAIYSFYAVAKELVYTSSSLNMGEKTFENNLLKLGWTNQLLDNAKEKSRAITNTIISKMNNDGYKISRTREIFEPSTSDGNWKPTPPDYRNALEPHWSNLLAISLDSNNQFRPVEPPVYNLEKKSKFREELDEVRYIVDSLQKNDYRFKSAKFWDCNPFVPLHTGHITVAEKKLTPGGHWISIAKNAMQKLNLDFSETSKIYALLSIGIYDSFISCWEAKYFYNYVRPITVIQKNFDENWTIALYTPNFPEYPSGHSVVSGAASTILTDLIGDNYEFIDSSEMIFGMPARTFNSFFEARDEAALSRLYGGIHFRSAIENGVEQGNIIGLHVLNKFN